MCAKLLQLCLTLWEAMDFSLPGSSAHGIIQTRILKWVAVLSSRSSQSMSPVSPALTGRFFTTKPSGKPHNGPEVKWSEVAQSCITLSAPWTVDHQAPPSMGFSRQESWRGCHCLLQMVFLTQGSNPDLPHCRQMLYHLSCQGSPGGPISPKIMSPALASKLFTTSITWEALKINNSL